MCEWKCTRETVELCTFVSSTQYIDWILPRQIQDKTIALLPQYIYWESAFTFPTLPHKPRHKKHTESHTRTHAHTCARARAHTHTYMHPHVHACTHTRIQALQVYISTDIPMYVLLWLVDWVELIARHHGISYVRHPCSYSLVIDIG